MKSYFIDKKILLIMAIVLTSCVEIPAPPTKLEEPAVEVRMCTLIGCNDGANVTILTQSKKPNFVFEATANGETAVCNLLQSTNEYSIIKCSSDHFRAFLSHLTNCENFELVNGDSIRCQGGRNRLIVSITYRGTPEQMTIRLMKHDKIVAESAFSFGEYKISQPNGPGCDPICRHANKVWVLH